MDPIFSLNQKLQDIKIFWIDDGYVGPEDIVLKNDEIYVGYDNGVIMNIDGIPSFICKKAEALLDEAFFINK